MISIIIPAYNEEENIGLCLTAISCLDFPDSDYEVILVDNGSTDRTREIASKFNVRIFKDPDGNVSSLRNLGAKHADGKILAFVDADCLVSPQWLKKASTYIDEERLAAWGAPPEIPEKSTWVQKTWFLVRKKETRLQDVDWLESMNLFVRKSQFIAIDGFNESLMTCEDVDFCYRISRCGKILCDTELKVVHLGEAQTLKEFFQKEIWRGHSNLKGLLSHGIQRREIPSLMIPIYFGAVIPFFLAAGGILNNTILLWGAAILAFLPTVLVLYKIRNKEKNIRLMFNLIGLLQIYFFARTIAVLKKRK